MKKVVEVEEVPIDMEIVQEILQGSARIDKMRKDIKESMSLLRGLIQKVLAKKSDSPRINFTTGDENGFHWKVYVYGRSDGRDIGEVIVSANFRYASYESGNFSQMPIDASQIVVVWEALPSLFQIVQEHFPEITEKLALFRRVSKR